jgi:predicted Zn-dependent protease/energy-coupling factor transporter ATP-binding protein EcfA2
MNVSREHPFPGLRLFDFDDREFFFGREDQTYALYRLLNRSRFVAVVGSSGSGKSSLVRAGLLPLLHEETDDESGGACWSFATFRPGTTPMAGLRDAVVSLAPSAEGDQDILIKDVESALNASSFGLTKAIDEIPALRNRKILIVVDQFEELFTYSGRRDEATNFVQLLLEATRSYSSRIHVLITMRSDFIGYCAIFQRLPEAVSAAQFLVPSLNRDQRAEAIRRPIEIAGGAIEPLLVERLLNDSGAEIDQLPVLQHCLSRLWERASFVDGIRTLTTKEYEGLGGIGEALSRHADEVMNELGKPMEPVVEAVFRALSATDQDGRATRRVISFAKLTAETGLPEADLRKVLDRFRADDCAFILPLASTKPRLTDQTKLDIVHEALLRKWSRLSAPPTLVDGKRESGWLAAEAEDGWEYRALLNLVKSGSRSGTVTLPLDQVESRYDWWTSRKRTPEWGERYGGDFVLVDKLMTDSLAALKAYREKERQDEIAAAQERERAEQRRRDHERQKIKEEFAAARARRTRAAAFAMGVLALIALVSAGWAFNANKQLEGINKQLKVKQADLALANIALGKKTDQLSKQTIQLDKANKLLTKAKIQLAARNADLSKSNQQLQTKQVALSNAKSQLAHKNDELNSLVTLREAERVTYQGAGLAMVKTFVDTHRGNADARIDLGDFYQQQGDLTHAAAEFRDATQIDPHSAYAYASLCQVEEEQKNDRGAGVSCARALSFAPRMTYALRQRGVVEMDNHDYTAALRDLSAAVAFNAKESINWADLCEAQVKDSLQLAKQSKDTDAKIEQDLAIFSCRRALKLDSSMASAYYWLGRADAAERQWAVAIAALTASIKAGLDDHTDLSAHYWRGRGQILLGMDTVGTDTESELEDGINDMKFLLDNGGQSYSGDEDGFDAHYWRGVGEFYAGLITDDQSSLNAAKTDLTAALASLPTDQTARYQRGKDEIALKQWRAASQDLLAVKNYSELNAYWLALAYFYALDYKHAFDEIKQYIANPEGSNDGDGYYLLARILLSSGDADDATTLGKKARTVYGDDRGKSRAAALVDEIDLIRRAGLMADFTADGKALLTNPNNAKALTDRGDIYETVDDRSWAIDDYTAAIAVDPDDAYAYASRCQSEVETASGNAAYDTAKDDCDKAIALDPKLAYAFRQRVYVGLGLLDLDGLAQVNSDANQAVTLDPQANSYLTRCKLYVVTQRYSEAISDCTAVTKLAPQRSTAFYWRAKARLGAADYTNGLADIDEYLKSNSDDGDGYLVQARLELGLGNRTLALNAANTALHYYQQSNDKNGVDTAQRFIKGLTPGGASVGR